MYGSFSTRVFITVSFTLRLDSQCKIELFFFFSANISSVYTVNCARCHGRSSVHSLLVLLSVNVPKVSFFTTKYEENRKKNEQKIKKQMNEVKKITKLTSSIIK